MRKILSCLGLSLFAAFHFTYAQCESFKEEFIDPAYELKYDSADQSLRIINEGIKKIEGSSNKTCRGHLATAYLVRGMALRTKSLYAEAQSAMEKAKRLRRKLGDKIGVVKVLNALSSNAKEEGDFPKAFDYSNLALTRLNQLATPRSPKTVGNAYVAAINLLIELDFYTILELEKHIETAKEAYRKMNGDSSWEMAIANYNLAVGYNKKGAWKKAYPLLLASYDFFNASEDIFSIAMIENELGIAMLAQDSLLKAKNHFQKSIDFFNDVNSQDGTILPSLGFAETLLKGGNTKEAIALADSIKLSPEELPDIQERLAWIYINAYQALGEVKPMALQLFKLDSINKVKNESYKTYYVLNDRQRLKELLETQESINKNQSYTLIAIMAVSLLAIILFIFRVEAEKKKNSAQKIDTETQKQEKKFQEKIAQILKGHNHYISIDRNKLNRKLHDVICPKIINVKREMEYYLMTKKEEGLMDAMELADRLYEDTRALIRNEENLEIQTDWLQDIMLIINQQKRIGKLEINEHFDLNPQEIPPVIGNQIAFVVNVLLENIEKWAKAKQASISIIRENGSVMMVVDDDGVGFSSNEVRVKDIPNSSGIGLKNVKYRIEEELNGKLKIDSRKGEGTTINISIPLNTKPNETQKKGKN